MNPGDWERMEQDKMIEDRLSRIKRKILVMSGKGGVGKSTVATYLALHLSQAGRNVGLLDVDLHGPSIPRLLKIKGGLKIEGESGVGPHVFSDHLRVVSMEMVMADKDTAVIWRGPLKISAIRQFISDISWGALDYLVIDAPPGTGDEPLTVAQNIPDSEALIVTTPQEISLADVRKSIQFCHQVGMKIRGILENMSGYVCPHCDKEIQIFGAGGGEKMAAQMGLPFLGRIPIEPEMVEKADQGELDSLVGESLEINRAYRQLVERLEGG
jgi:Mrp family chromosome partitioning ATPase